MNTIEAPSNEVQQLEQALAQPDLDPTTGPGGCDAVLGRESLHVLGRRFAFWVQRGPEFGELPGVPAFSNASAISASRR